LIAELVARAAAEVRTVEIKDPRGIATASRVVSKLVMSCFR